MHTRTSAKIWMEVVTISEHGLPESLQHCLPVCIVPFLLITTQKTWRREHDKPGRF